MKKLYKKAAWSRQKIYFLNQNIPKIRINYNIPKPTYIANYICIKFTTNLEQMYPCIQLLIKLGM